MSGILGVSSRFRTETVIERSRFIATCERVCCQEEARAFVARVRAEFSDATHNCYAFVADKTGNLMRFGDDGEPQGTAGTPILDAIRGRKLYETAVVVTRYFGGIKLGAGGLVRAYAGAAGACLDGAEKRLYERCVRISVTVGYELADPMKKWIAQNDCVPIDMLYTDRVQLILAVKQKLCEQLLDKIIDFAAGKVTVEKQDEFYFPFPLQE